MRITTRGARWAIASAVLALDASPPLRPIPAVVLTADKPIRADLQSSGIDIGVTFDDWLVGQDLLAAGLAAEHVTQTDSGHNVYLYAPSLVNRAIHEVVADVRHAKPVPS